MTQLERSLSYRRYEAPYNSPKFIKERTLPLEHCKPKNVRKKTIFIVNCNLHPMLADYPGEPETLLSTRTPLDGRACRRLIRGQISTILINWQCEAELVQI